MATEAAMYTVVDGFRCYAPELATSCADYPTEGFEITIRLEAESFWCRTRNRILCAAVRRYADTSRPLDMLRSAAASPA